MYFPVAEIDTPTIVPLASGFVISFFCSTAGISGAFLLLPFQVSWLGYTLPGVSATNQIFNILACPAGVWRYAREGRLLPPLALFIAIGTLPGVFLGAYIRIAWLARPRHFMLFAALMLFYLGYRMLRSQKKQNIQSGGSGAIGKCRVMAVSPRGFRFAFDNQIYAVSGVGLIVLSLLVGIAGGIYGVGGGAIMVPFLVSFFGLPVHAIAGSTLLATFLTSLAGVAFFSLLAVLTNSPQASPDWLLGALFGLGGMAGMYLGAAAQKFIPARHIRFFIIFIVLFMAARYLLKFFQAPGS